MAVPGPGEADVTVEIVHAFGSHCGTELRDSVFFGDDAGHYIVYPVGRHIAFRHVDTGEMNFVLGGEHVSAVTACTISSDKSLLAVCESCIVDPLSRVTVYDLKSVGVKPMKTLEGLGGAARKLVGVTFSHDSPGPPKYMAVASGGADAAVSVIDWQKGKILGECACRAAVTRVAFSPLDPNQVSASGNRFMRLLKLRENSLKAFPAFSGLTEAECSFSDHAWIQPGSGAVVTCTAEGIVYILNCETLSVARVIDEPFLGTGAEVIPHCVRCFSQGFVLGGSLGHIAVWEKVDDSKERPGQPTLGTKEVRLAKTLHVGRKAHVCSLDITDSEETMVLGFQNADIGHLSMASLYLGKDEDVVCNIVSMGFHCGAVTGLDIAAQRPVIASVCQRDCSVRIWNYVTKQCELGRVFVGDEPISVSMHPFGYFLAVGFVDKLRFFHILLDELRLYREFSIRGARLLRFSNGGHFLAAAHGKLILIFATRTLNKVATLRAHSAQVTAMSFDPNDDSLATVGADGCLYEWSTQTWGRTHEHVARNSEYSCVSFDSGGRAICGASEGSKSYVREFKQCDLKQELELAGGARLGAACHHAGGSAMLAVTSTGSLWVYPYPLADSIYEEYGLHSGSCNLMCTSLDGRTLITAGEDGAIFILSVNGLTGPDAESADRASEAEHKMADVVLINRTDIQVKQDRIVALMSENSTLQNRLHDETTRLEKECATRVAQSRLQDQGEISELQRRYEALQQAATSKERESLRIIKSLETSHIAAADQLEGLYEKKIMHEADRYVELEVQKRGLEKQMEELQEKFQRQLQQEREKLQAEFSKKLEEKEEQLQKQQTMNKYLQHRYDTMIGMEEAEHEHEIRDLAESHQMELKEQKSVCHQLKKEQDTLLRGLDRMEKDKERVAREQQEASQNIANLQEVSEELNRTVNGLFAERKERESTLNEKEKKISEYKQKVATLKKFRHVLDYRLREVTELLQPKDQKITALTAHLHDLESEFEKQLGEQRNMETVIEQKTQKIHHMTEEQKKLRDTIKSKERIIEKFSSDLYNLVNNQQLDIREWPREIKRMYHEYVSKDDHVSKEDQQSMEELDRQMKLMERKIRSLAMKGGRTEVACKTDIQRKSHENSLLIHELNELRMEKRGLQDQVKNLELNLRQTQQKLEQAHNERGMLRSGSSGRLMPIEAGGAPPPPAGRPSGSVPPKPAGRRPPSPGSGSVERRLPGQLRKGNNSHMSPEERQRMQNLLLTADLNSQQIQMQKLENKILRDQVQKLLEERQRILSGGATFDDMRDHTNLGAGQGGQAQTAAAPPQDEPQVDASVDPSTQPS
eukprot:gnl/MRDRNA2_/MRDRNA2_93427_c0_seq1.p1 gnl/MRDRNA2_/MRDRNA2_93427_c0~~gnl/MRDRNA2_/MRDRNA2_93427_c0_seq1.p1  ORF type:complete len:1327 (-),score=290.79 gnl/MRDRNA2_/MRDRNA2_93427_c0_seq1:168-4148(-)